MSIYRIPLLAALIVFCLLPTGAKAHEPLWGESPQTFGFGVFHPEFRLGYENDHLLLRGSRLLDNPAALRRSRLDALLSFQYAPKTSLNLKVDIPVVAVSMQQRIGTQLQRSSVTGLGDIVLSAKSRFYQKFGEDWKVHHAYMVGLQLPTGEQGGRYPDGSLLSPSDQPGSGKLGWMLGYAFAYERLKDTVWASAMVMGDFGSNGTKGDMLQLDANYGYWIKRALKPQDLGIILAGGVHGEWMSRDRLATGADPDSGYTLAGLQSSLIATKGQGQARIGLLIPVYQRVNGTQLRSEVQVRAGVEILL
jgi:hypothetical protein